VIDCEYFREQTAQLKKHNAAIIEIPFMTPKATLDLAPIGNCAATALIDRRGRFVWACYPRVDGEPVISALLEPACGGSEEAGFWAVEMADLKDITQD
jgi:hypothetical protein